MAPNVHKFDVYGFRFSIRSTADDVQQGLRQDFEYFSSDTAPDLAIDLVSEEPPVDQVPPSDAVVYTPRNVVYAAAGKRYIDYHGRALGIQSIASQNFTLYSRDPNLLYEAAYLYLLAEI
ncbi:MAG: hypothetical protein JO091_14205, partial [Acidobacteriaceae bacterium]|nr:hypothetical protein [Acidobacteriaceae bacterium]